MIENTVASVVYTADGAQTQWTIPFTYGHAEDVKLFVKVGTADIAPIASNLFSIDTELNTITYPLSGDPLAANDKVIVMRVTAQTQEESSAMLSFKSEDIERMADKLTMEVQELQEQLSRCIAFNPVDAAEGELDAQQYIDDLTELGNIATTQAGIATQKAGEAATSATNAENSNIKSQKWAEGTDQEVTALGGTKSSKGWAAVAQAAAESPAVQTVAENIEDVNTVAGISMDVSTVSSVHSKVSTVADDITNIDAVVDNKTNIDTVANNITNVNDVAAIKNDVTTVAGNSANVTTVATNISDVNAVADDIAKVTSVADDLSNIDAVKNNLTEINDVNDNKANINAVAANATNINTVAADKTNIDAVAGNATNINTVATNISDVNDVAEDIAKVSAVAGDLTAIDAVNNNKTNIDTVATNISDVTSVAAAIADVSAVADDLTNIDSVADDLTNIDTVAASLPDIQDKQNKVLTNSVILGGETQTTVEGALEALSEDWVKPSDWVDIESGAIDNSIYLLVGHSADYSKFPYFACNVRLSDSTHKFKLYIDYNLHGTYTSNSDVKLSWQELNLSTGGETTFPESLKTHIIRITPEDNTDTITYNITRYANSGVEQQGVLWAHFTVPQIDRVSFASYNPPTYNPDLVAITSIGNNLHITGPYLYGFLGMTQDRYKQRSHYLAKIPVIEVETLQGIAGAFNHEGPLKKAKLVVNNSITANQGSGINLSTSFGSGNIEEIEINKPIILTDLTSSAGSLFRDSNIKKLPAFDFSSAKRLNLFVTENTNLKDTVLDVSSASGLQKIDVHGTSANRQDGLKGLYVSNSAPFDGDGPQIDVSYTGLDRSALVNLFNSMPTVSANQICNITGATGAADLTAEDLAIATAKGWTITR